MKLLRSVWAVAFWCVPHAFLAGCGDSTEPEPCQPAIPSGTIAGFVRMGQVPIDATVRATRTGLAPSERALFETKVGPDGSYLMEVPDGRYVVGLRLGDEWDLTYEYSVAGVKFGDGPPDTLLVDARHPLVDIDFDLASLRIYLELAVGLDGGRMRVQLHRRDPLPARPRPAYRQVGSGTVQGGSAELIVSGILPGTYRIELIVGQSGEHFWIPGVQDSADSPWFDVPADQTPEVSGHVGPDPAQIQGRITGAWLDLGLGTNPPSLALVSASSSAIRGLWGVEADGHFNVAVYVLGPVKLLVRQEGIDQWIGGRTLQDATTFQLEAGQTISGIEFAQSGMRLEVEIPYFRIEWTWFRLYDATTLSLQAAWLLQNESDLTLAIPNLRPGTYRMYIVPDRPGMLPWAPQWFDRMSEPASAAPLTIAYEGQVLPVSVVLEKGGTIAGVVREVDGATANYYLYATRADDPAAWAHAFAFGGSFQFEGLPDGDWKVGALRRYELFDYPDQPPPETVWFPGTSDWNAAGIVPIRDFADVTGIEISMPAMLAR